MVNFNDIIRNVMGNTQPLGVSPVKSYTANGQALNINGVTPEQTAKIVDQIKQQQAIERIKAAQAVQPSINNVAPAGYNPKEDIMNRLRGDGVKVNNQPTTPTVDPNLNLNLPELVKPVVRPTLQPVEQPKPRTEDLIRDNPHLFSTDRIWEAARTAGYQGDANDIMSTDSKVRMKVENWYRQHLLRNPEIVQRENEKMNPSPENLYKQTLLNQYNKANSGYGTDRDPVKALQLAKEIDNLNTTREKTQYERDFADRKLNIATEADYNKLTNDRALEFIKGGYGVKEAVIKAEAEIGSVMAKMQAEKAAAEKGFQLPAGNAEKLSQSLQAIPMLDNLLNSSKSLPDYIFTPVIAQGAGATAWLGNRDVAGFNQLVASTKQVIGKGLEGGVLRAEDEKKYEKIIPRLGDTREILAQKGEQLRQLIVNKYLTDIQTLKNVGYSTGNMPVEITTKMPMQNKLPLQPQYSFNSVQEAEQANLPSGTMIMVNGRQAVVE